jgi:hypothetical protein
MNAKISAAILLNLKNGMSLPEAMDAVLGAGTYTKVVGELYDALRAKSV